jgi:hypothetical protein
MNLTTAATKTRSKYCTVVAAAQGGAKLGTQITTIGSTETYY